jgi:hypothetical protein
MSKIFVRQRRHVGEGAGRPRFTVVAVHGTDLHIYKSFIRRAELEKLAADTGAEIVYLPRGEHTGETEEQGGKNRRRRRKQERE